MESTTNDTPAPPERNPLPNRGFGLTLTLVIGSFILAALVIGPVLNPQPHIPALLAVPVAGATAMSIPISPRPISPELIKSLMKSYGLDPCDPDKRFGAICKDGTLTIDNDPNACADNGGVNSWIECR